MRSQRGPWLGPDRPESGPLAAPPGRGHRWAPSGHGSDDRGGLLLGALALVLVEEALAEPEVLGRDLEELVVLDVLEALLEGPQGLLGDGLGIPGAAAGPESGGAGARSSTARCSASSSASCASVASCISPSSKLESRRKSASLSADAVAFGVSRELSRVTASDEAPSSIIEQTSAIAL